MSSLIAASVPIDADISILLIAGVAFLGVIFFFYFVPVRLWIAAWSSGAPVGIMTLIAMRLRRVSPAAIVNPLINATKAGLSLTTDQLECHYLAGGRVNEVIMALISANKANIQLDFNKAAAIDLAGRNVHEAVQMSVNPKVVTTPRVSAVAKDGIQLVVMARVTLRANIDKLVGGAGEETIIARVGEGIVSTIGSSASYERVLENPDIISKTVLSKGLDVGTAYQILSIDIADVDVGENVGAKLQTEQADADKRIAQARAEGRRAMAVAEEQEMAAKVKEMRARVIEAESQIPLAMADAFRSGNLGVMDYYNIKNIQADTQMRTTIAGPEGDRKGHQDEPK